MFTFPPVNKCIYCGKTQVALSDEHIIPYSLGGTLILPKASCKECADITKKTEQIVARNMYWGYRSQYNFPTRRKNEMPKELPVRLIRKDGSIINLNIPIQKHPVLFISLTFAQPGMLLDIPPSSGSPEMKIAGKLNQEKLKALLKEFNCQNIDLGNINASWVDVGLLLAKIAHGCIYALLGNEGYIPLLNDVILRKNQYIFYYIGGINNEESQKIENNVELKIDFAQVYNETFLIVYIRLLLNDSLPVYKAIAGKVTDLELIIKKLRDAPPPFKSL